MLAIHRHGVVALLISLIGFNCLALADGQETRLAAAEIPPPDVSVDRNTPERAVGPAGETGGRSDAPRRRMGPVWTPSVNRGRPAAREGGASRTAGANVSIRTLVPRLDEAALTLSAQPSLFFALSSRTNHSINFTLIDPKQITPLVDVMLEGPFEAGIHRIDLSRYGVSLEVGRSYEWFVAIVRDPERRSADSVARGALERVTRPALEQRSPTADRTLEASVLASEGIWYEALSRLGDGLDDQPDSAAVRDARRTLLEQAGLENVD